MLFPPYGKYDRVNCSSIDRSFENLVEKKLMKLTVRYTEFDSRSGSINSWIRINFFK